MDDFAFESWPTDRQQILQFFGQNPQKYVALDLPGHDGVDIAATLGSAIYSVAAGTVVDVRDTLSEAEFNRYGRYVTVEHRPHVCTTYAHLATIDVAPGDALAAGDQIGSAGQTGDSLFPHLLLVYRDPQYAQEGYRENIADPLPLLLPLLGWEPPSPPLREAWAYLPSLTVYQDLAQVGYGGTILRREPSLNAQAAGFIDSGTILSLTGMFEDNFAPVAVNAAAIKHRRRIYFPVVGAPEEPDVGWVRQEKLVGEDEITIAEGGALVYEEADAASAVLGRLEEDAVVQLDGASEGLFTAIIIQDDNLVPVESSEPLTVVGWAPTGGLLLANLSARVRPGGVTLFQLPERSAPRIGFIPAGNRVAVIGATAGFYTPVRVRKNILRPVTSPPPAVTVGWVPTGGLNIADNKAWAREGGVTMRGGPDTNFPVLGFIAAGGEMVITGPTEGFFTQVTVRNHTLRPVKPGPIDPPPPVGQARFGLHASADPLITDEEHQLFADARIDMIKVLSFHSPEDITRLKNQHPRASWVLRAFLEFRQGDTIRNISPQQFFEDTVADVERSLDVLAGRDVVVELHNEPNLVPEGLILNRSYNWWDGQSWAVWFQQLLTLYRRRLRGVRFIYPGLSPGSDIGGLRVDHVRFIEQSRWMVEACDGLAVHIYWSHTFSMQRALAQLDDYIARFPGIPIWVTEASNPDALRSVQQRATQYIEFWQALKKRPTVEGVTYFVASASDPHFATQVWLGTGIGALVGQR